MESEIEEIQKRVAEIQEKIKTAPTEEQKKMVDEIVEMATKLEQSLYQIKIDIEE